MKLNLCIMNRVRL